MASPDDRLRRSVAVWVAVTSVILVLGVTAVLTPLKGSPTHSAVAGGQSSAASPSLTTPAASATTPSAPASPSATPSANPLPSSAPGSAELRTVPATPSPTTVQTSQSVAPSTPPLPSPTTTETSTVPTAGVRDCQAVPLVLDDVLTSVGMHHQTDIYRLTNNGSVSCSLRGYPTLISEDASGKPTKFKVLHQAGADGVQDAPATTVVLQPKGVAYFYEFSGFPRLDGPVCHISGGRVQIAVTGTAGIQELDQDKTTALCPGLQVTLTPYFSTTAIPDWLSRLTQDEGYPLPPQ
jgi:hypothetical protein